MNRNSLGVEMCSDIVSGKYTITQQTVDRTVELVRWLWTSTASTWIMLCAIMT